MFYRLIAFISAISSFVSETRALRRELNERYRTVG
jgi:hypothetical protein